jgi:hypothetical protein
VEPPSLRKSYNETSIPRRTKWKKEEEEDQREASR